jgi:cyanophycin synthetase
MTGNLISVKEIKLYPGFAYGLRSPSLRVSIIVNDDKSLTNISSFFEIIGNRSPEVVAGLHLLEKDITINQVLDNILIIINNLFGLAKVPVFEHPRILNATVTAPLISNEFILLIPTCMFGEKYSIFVLQWLLSLINKFTEANDFESELKNIEEVSKSAKFLSLYGSNFRYFARAAYEMGMQVSFVVDKIFQFGQAGNARWMESSFTDETSLLGAQLARNKMSALKVLREAGMPVPDHELVKNLPEALQAARKLQYPVVVKPLDLDGGLGVAADIRSDKELMLAYSEAIKYSKNILIEKHIDGKDYRINIFHGQVLWAIERVYAGVIGDGQSSIRLLVDLANSDVRRGKDNKSSLRTIVIDDEMLDFLDSRNMSLDGFGRWNM